MGLGRAAEDISAPVKRSQALTLASREHEYMKVESWPRHTPVMGRVWPYICRAGTRFVFSSDNNLREV